MGCSPKKIQQPAQKLIIENKPGDKKDEIKKTDGKVIKQASDEKKNSKI